MQTPGSWQVKCPPARCDDFYFNIDSLSLSNIRIMVTRQLRQTVAHWIAIGALSFCSAAQSAATRPLHYPDHPVRLLVGFAPGGGSDTAARIITPKLSEALGYQWVIDNRPGAAGNIATEIA